MLQGMWSKRCKVRISSITSLDFWIRIVQCVLNRHLPFENLNFMIIPLEHWASSYGDIQRLLTNCFIMMVGLATSVLPEVEKAEWFYKTPNSLCNLNIAEQLLKLECQFTQRAFCFYWNVKVREGPQKCTEKSRCDSHHFFLDCKRRYYCS